VVKHNQISSKKKLTLDIYQEEQFIVVKNNLQFKETYGNGTSFGLTNLAERYKFLAGREIKIQKTAEHFIVKVPIINLGSDESTDI
jgi:hypothetical protein